MIKTENDVGTQTPDYLGKQSANHTSIAKEQADYAKRDSEFIPMSAYANAKIFPRAMLGRISKAVGNSAVLGMILSESDNSEPHKQTTPDELFCDGDFPINQISPDSPEEHCTVYPQSIDGFLSSAENVNRAGGVQ